MPADQPSREFRLEHLPDGERMLVPVTDPPGAPEPEALPAPPATPRRTSRAPAWVVAWAPVVVALLGAGGAPSLVAALRGDGQARATADLARQVQSLEGQVARLNATVERLADRHTELRATVEAREQARREQLTTAASHLTQPPRPDVPGALRVLRE